MPLKMVIGAGLTDQLIRQVERLDGAGIRPPTLKQIPCQHSGLDIGVVDVRNFQLSPRRRFE